MIDDYVYAPDVNELSCPFSLKKCTAPNCMAWEGSRVHWTDVEVKVYDTTKGEVVDAVHQELDKNYGFCTLIKR